LNLGEYLQGWEDRGIIAETDIERLNLHVAQLQKLCNERQSIISRMTQELKKTMTDDEIKESLMTDIDPYRPEWGQAKRRRAD